METPDFQIEKLTGVGNKKVASGIFTSRVSFADGSLASLVSCILVSEAGEQDAQVTARDIFEIATKKLEGAAGLVLESLLAARDAAIDYLKTREAGASFVHIAFYKQAAYIARVGQEVRVFVFKPPKSVEITFDHGSGPTDAGQIYLAATDDFVKNFKLEEHLESLTNLEEIVDGLATEISAIGDSAKIAAALVLVKSDKGEEPIAQEKVEGSNDIVDSGDESSGKGQESGKSEAVLENADDGVLPEEPHFAVKAEDNLGPAWHKDDMSEKPRGIGPIFKNFSKRGILTLSAEYKGIKSNERLAILRLRRNIVVVAAVILIILAVSVGFAIKNKRDRTTLADFNDHLLAASTKFSEGEAIISLNRGRAREFFSQAGDEVAKALVLKAKDAKAEELKVKIESALKETENSASLSFSTLAQADEPLISLTTLGKKIVGVGDGKIFIIDTSAKSVDRLDGISGARAAFGFNDSVFILADAGVYKVNVTGKKSEKVAEGKSAFDVGVFFGNIYLLASAQIYKYVPVEGGYVASADYLQGASFESNSRMAIDGSIWVTRGGQIMKFLKGEAQNFAISGLSNTEAKFGKIYTNADSNNLYVIDQTNRALLAIGKDGVYKKSYQASEFGRASGLVVDEAAGKMYVSVDDKILEASL